MSSSEPVVQVDQLTIERNGYILKDICWQVMPGENWVILGANGSGKTALLKSLMGYFPPTRGTLSVLEKPTEITTGIKSASASGWSPAVSSNG